LTAVAQPTARMDGMCPLFFTAAAETYNAFVDRALPGNTGEAYGAPQI